MRRKTRKSALFNLQARLRLKRVLCQGGREKTERRYIYHISSEVFDRQRRQIILFSIKQLDGQKLKDQGAPLTND